MANPLPLEIWLLVCQELALEPDPNSLFDVALVTRDFARLSLPLLYSVHSPNSLDASLDSSKKRTTFWRSLTLSSIGKTAYPYVLWIPKLELGDLQDLLDQNVRLPAFRRAFFEGEMSEFSIVAPKNASREASQRTLRSHQTVDSQAICLRVGEMVTCYVRDAAVRDDKNIALTNLEGWHIPLAVLPTWVSRLSTLRSLTLRDGSVLGPTVADAIRLNCPAFRELRCFYCTGASVDEDMASFLRNLRPRSLEHFQIISLHRLGHETFTALSACHAGSLKALLLSSLDPPAVQTLHMLAKCTALEELRLDSTRQDQFGWEVAYPDSFQGVVSWLRRCSSLRDLRMGMLQDAPSLLTKVLGSEKVALTSLQLTMTVADEDFYAALAHQKTMQKFDLILEDDDLLWTEESGARELLLRAIRSWPDAVDLGVNAAPVTAGDLWELADALPKLEKIAFDGELLEDDVWEPLLRMPRLKTVAVQATSRFTAAGIEEFIVRMADETEQAAAGGGRTTAKKRERERHWGLSLQIMGQVRLCRLEDEAALVRLIRERLDGEVTIVYINDPNEEHESDFSD